MHGVLKKLQKPGIQLSQCSKTTAMETYLLSDVENKIYLQPASLGRRFANMLLDIIGFYVFALFVGLVLGFAGACFGEDVDPGGIHLGYEYLIHICAILVTIPFLKDLQKAEVSGNPLPGRLR
jgi:hypothetical protein